MRLSELSPKLFDPPDGHYRVYQSLKFLCPRCRKHEIMIDIWGLASRDRVEVSAVEGESAIKRLWHAEQGPCSDWNSFTITPSINRTGLGDKCGGWHGFITAGEVSPG